MVRGCVLADDGDVIIKKQLISNTDVYPRLPGLLHATGTCPRSAIPDSRRPGFYSAFLFNVDINTFFPQNNLFHWLHTDCTKSAQWSSALSFTEPYCQKAISGLDHC